MTQNTRISLLEQRLTKPVIEILSSVQPDCAPPASLYVHIPFCSHKCHYCDFYSIVDTQDRQAKFTKRLVEELEALAPFAARPLCTVFFGGGTPSLLRLECWSQVLETLDSHFDLSFIKSGQGEFTVECNPESVTKDLMTMLAAGGTNRVSMGSQSFHPAHLKTLERLHDPAHVQRAMEQAREAGISRISTDLIYAVPGQTLDHWREDLSIALQLGTDHLSCYNLTYEPNTAMTARLARGEFTPTDEDLEVDMFLETTRILEENGLLRYEVSNYARPGQQCQHNLAYWRQENWLAAGPSASAHVSGHRWKNLPRLDDYLTRSAGGLSMATDHEVPEARRNLCERLMTGLRLAEGIDAIVIKQLADAIQPDLAARLFAKRDEFVNQKLMTDTPSSFTLTVDGLLIENRITIDFMRVIDRR